ncbi:hypothetical protein F3Y22_tig00110551pilonHSYRG00142 [Hibiscus syriacus]|uniref:Uncharacterized protein n=1 Tax=Hibiscus syriacus TaxID=106335 RepID=A0A6A3ADI4_HIBSY|nr:hypothetical protein F3Y22_tig00110551pilonHSYRG00142 [Hibiscus syriacus]
MTKESWECKLVSNTMKRFFKPIEKEGSAKKPTLSPSKQCVENGDAQPEVDIKKEPLKFLTWNATSLLIRVKNNWPEFSIFVSNLDPNIISIQDLIEFQQVKKRSTKETISMAILAESTTIHLAKQRNLLPNTTKIDKASLFVEVIQHAKELKRKTCFDSRNECRSDRNG